MDTYTFSHQFSDGMQNYFLVKSTNEIAIPTLAGLRFPAHAAILSGLEPSYTENGIWVDILPSPTQDIYLFFIPNQYLVASVQDMNQTFQDLVEGKNEQLFADFRDGNIVIGVKKVPLGMVVGVVNQTDKDNMALINFLFPNLDILPAYHLFRDNLQNQWSEIPAYYQSENCTIEKKFWKSLGQYAEPAEVEFIQFCKKQFKSL